MKKFFKIFVLCSIVGVIFITAKIINIYAEPKASLVVEFGEVFYSLDNKNYIKVDEREMDVDSGVFIKTNIGKANIILPNNSVITVDENTNIQLTYNTTLIDIMQVFGNTWHRVKNLGGISYTVRTPNAVAAVRGTEFSVEVDRIAQQVHTKVMVTEHQVDLSEISPPNNALKVTEGMIGEVSGNELKVNAIPEKVKETNWYKENQVLTTILDTTQKNDNSQSNTEIIKKVTEETSPGITVTPSATPISAPRSVIIPTNTPIPVPEKTPPPSPTPVPPPPPGEVYIDQVVGVNGTFGHCCSDLSSDPAVAQSFVTGSPDGNFIQISDNSTIFLKFTNNKVVDKPGADIRVYNYDQLFPASAVFAVGSGPDCLSTAYKTLGTFEDTSNVYLDIAGTGFASVQCLKITDLESPGDPYPMLGFDLDAVEAIHSEIIN